MLFNPLLDASLIQNLCSTCMGYNWTIARSSLVVDSNSPIQMPKPHVDVVNHSVFNAFITIKILYICILRSL